MQAGKLNRRVQLQQQTTGQDDAGQLQTTWNTVYTCWSKIDIQASQLLYSTAEFVEKVTHRITVRWTSSQIFQPNMRLVYIENTTGVTHTYNIEAFDNTRQGNRELVCLCYELDGAE